MCCEARIRGSGEVLGAKSTFFLVWALNRNDPSLPTALLTGFSTMKGNPVLFSVFWNDNSWPYQETEKSETGTRNQNHGKLSTPSIIAAKRQNYL